jgi:hypothetical protein
VGQRVAEVGVGFNHLASCLLAFRKPAQPIHDSTDWPVKAVGAFVGGGVVVVGVLLELLRLSSSFS